jgi:hypothetical protein
MHQPMFVSWSGAPSPMLATSLPDGVEEALVGWLEAQGYEAWAAPVSMFCSEPAGFWSFLRELFRQCNAHIVWVTW